MADVQAPRSAKRWTNEGPASGSSTSRRSGSAASGCRTCSGACRAQERVQPDLERRRRRGLLQPHRPGVGGEPSRPIPRSARGRAPAGRCGGPRDGRRAQLTAVSEHGHRDAPRGQQGVLALRRQPGGPFGRSPRPGRGPAARPRCRRRCRPAAASCRPAASAAVVVVRPQPGRQRRARSTAAPRSSTRRPARPATPRRPRSARRPSRSPPRQASTRSRQVSRPAGPPHSNVPAAPDSAKRARSRASIRAIGSSGRPGYEHRAAAGDAVEPPRQPADGRVLRARRCTRRAAPSSDRRRGRAAPPARSRP